MKVQGKISLEKINEEEMGSLPEKEFRIMRVKMIRNLGNRMEKIQETFNKDVEVNRKQKLMKNTINEIKNSLQGINSRITKTEEWISDLEDKILEITTENRIKKKE